MADQRSSSFWRWARWILLGVGVVALVGLGWALLEPQWWLEHIDGITIDDKDKLSDDDKDRLDTLDKARGRIVGIGTALLAAVAIYYTAANAASARRTAEAAQGSLKHSEDAQRQTHELTERGQLTDRFTAAVAQLGDPSPAVRLGGVHALAGIADDAPTWTLRQTCIDVLCAYLRLPYDPDPGEDSQRTEDRKAYRALREVRHTIIRLIGNHLRLATDDPRSWGGHDFDFTDVVFDGGELGGANFSGGIVSFWRANFSGGGTDFRNAVFSGGRVNFRYAVFSGGAIAFNNAVFSGGQADFSGAEFSGGKAYFNNAVFSGGTAIFNNAKFSNGRIDFKSAVFSGGDISFSGAEFSGGRVYFNGAIFSGGDTSFSGAEFSDGEVYFNDTIFSGGDTSFSETLFSGGQVSFNNTVFSGGRVDFSNATGERPASLPRRDIPKGLLFSDEWEDPDGAD